jgi:hypothetical protein
VWAARDEESQTMSQSKMISAEIARQLLGGVGEVVATESYTRLYCTPEGSPLSGSVTADNSHAGFTVTGDKALRKRFQELFDQRFGDGLTVDTVFGPVKGTVKADAEGNGNRYSQGRWSFSKSGIRFTDDEHVPKAVARGLMMAELARILVPLVSEACEAEPAALAA